MEMKIKNRLVEIRRFENVMTIVLQIVRPVDGLTCCVSTLNFAAVHRSVLVTKRYLLSMLAVKSNMIIEKMEMMKMMDMNDAHRLRPRNPPLDVLSHFVASRRTVEHGRLQPKQTYSLYLEFVFVCISFTYKLRAGKVGHVSDCSPNKHTGRAKKIVVRKCNMADSSTNIWTGT